MFDRELNKWMIEHFLKWTLEREVYQAKVQTNPKYIFIKPELLCNADTDYKIQFHNITKYVSCIVKVYNSWKLTNVPG